MDGYWCLVLHSHLPFVRHPEYEDFLEEDWFYEALLESYIPLLNIFEELSEEGVEFNCAITFSPTLCSMLTDELLQNRFEKRLNKLIELSEKEVLRTKYQSEFHETAKLYENKFKLAKKIFEKYNRNILKGFKKIQDDGKIEILTSAATHPLLPLIHYKNIIHAQIKTAVDNYIENFDTKPRGIWLPECAYQPGIEEILKKEEIKFFFLEAHGILYASPRPRYGTFAPVSCPNGLIAFGRDMETAHQVWSADIGYPGDFDYREFYRDVGYDLDYEYIKPYLHSDGIRRNIGIKYYRITGRVPLSMKQPYVREWAINKAAVHAGNFMFNREHQIKYLKGFLGINPIIVSPYDTELFGHWWFEGPEFLKFLFKKIHYDQKTFKTISPSKYLQIHKKHQIVLPASSSWGDKGYFEVWLCGANDWIYRHLHKACERMTEIAKENKDAKDLKRRGLNQALRELFLALSSDWAFIMTSGTMVEYAKKRTVDHIINFTNLYNQIKRNEIDESYLSFLEMKNNIFPKINYKIVVQS